MGSQGKVAPDNYAVRVGEDEIGRILGLKQNHDLSEELLRTANRYHQLGWKLAVVRGWPFSDLGVDFSQPQDSWSKTLRELALREGQLGLAMHTGEVSRHFVLEVSSEDGFAALAHLGDWRGACVAHAGSSRELHYFQMPPQRIPPATKELPGLAVTVHGEGGLAPLPPTPDSRSQEAWRWLVAPWEHSPGYPIGPLWDFLERHQVLHRPAGMGVDPELPSWDELFHHIAAFEDVMQALLAPASSPQEYYQRLLHTAWGAGLTHPNLLKGLLWHAPHGDAKQRPERWEYLQTLVAGVSDGGMTLVSPPGPVPGRYGSHPDSAAARLPSARGAPAWDNWRPPAYPAPGGGGLGAQMPQHGQEPGRFDYPPVKPGLGRPPLRQSSLGETFAFMEDRVILERSRYEAMVFEMGKLSSRAAELEQRLAEYERRLQSHSLDPGAPGRNLPEPEPPSQEVTPTVSGVTPAQPEKEIQPAVPSLGPVGEFLKNNPDLAGDPGTPKMLLFCLKNYIDIDPSNSGLTLEEKLVKAGDLVRDFMGKKPK